MKLPIKRILQALIIIALGIGLVLSYVGYKFYTQPLVTSPPAVSVIIEPGTGIRNVALQLHQRGLMPYPYMWIALARWQNTAKLLKAGEYEIPPMMTAPQFLANVVAGKVVLHSITFIEGWTFKDLRNALDNNPFIQHTFATLTDEELMAKLGHPGVKPEGQFFPDTYSFIWHDKDSEILKLAFNKMADTLAFQWQQRAPNLPYDNAYQALIAASMVEKETAFPGERPQVSGVIARRIKKGMRLQIDAAVFYGLHQPMTYHLTKKDLGTDTPFNTYMHTGLPPTPICLPSEESIYAAMHPDNSNSLYYVARGDGSDKFSDTYEIHRQAVQQYILKVKPDAPKASATVPHVKSPSSVTVPPSVVPTVKPKVSHAKSS